MAVDPDRAARDLREKTMATAYEEQADRLLIAAVGAQALDRALREHSTRGKLQGWRWRMLREIAKEQNIAGAVALHKRADAIYWNFALRHEPLIRKYARKHAVKSSVPVDTVLPVMWEAAYASALLWDPTRASYATTFMWYALAAWQRAPERHGVVIPGETREIRSIKGGFGSLRHATVSIDTPVEDGGMGGDVADPTPAHDVVHAEAQRVEAIRRAFPVLTQRQQDAVRYVLDDGLANVEIAERMRCSREYVRQLRQGAEARLRVALGIASALPAE